MTGQLLLAIDTCTRYASIAISQGDEVLAELTWLAGHDHTAQTAPRLQHLLSQCSLRPENLEAVVVAVGPGSFNGVRAGMALAKSLAFGLGVSLVGISALEVQAYPYAPTGLLVCPIQDAGRGELAAALYRIEDGSWQQLRPEGITSWEELEELVTRPAIICGDLYPNLAPEIQKRLGARALMAPPSAAPRRASYLAELGRQKLETGDIPPIGEVQPLYLRRPAISQRKKP